MKENPQNYWGKGEGGGGAGPPGSPNCYGTDKYIILKIFTKFAKS